MAETSLFLRNFNGHGKGEQSHNEGLQHRLCVDGVVRIGPWSDCVRTREGGKIDPASTIFTSFCAGWG